MENEYTYGDVINMDKALYQLAAYDASGGMIMIVDSPENIASLDKKIAEKFNYFKRLLQNSEITFPDLQKAILHKNGPFPNKKRNMTLDETIDSIIKNSKSEEKEDINKSATSAMSASVFQKLFMDILSMGNAPEQGSLKFSLGEQLINPPSNSNEKPKNIKDTKIPKTRKPRKGKNKES